MLTNVLHICLCQYFVIKMGMGLQGIGMAFSISSAFNFLGMNVYPFFVQETREAMRLPTIEVLQDLSGYLQKGLPLMMMVCFEWWCFDIILIFTGFLGVAEQAAQTVFMNVSVVFFCPALGLQTAVSCKIGNEIGRQNVEKAKAYLRVSCWIAYV